MKQTSNTKIEERSLFEVSELVPNWTNFLDFPIAVVCWRLEACNSGRVPQFPGSALHRLLKLHLKNTVDAKVYDACYSRDSKSTRPSIKLIVKAIPNQAGERLETGDLFDLWIFVLGPVCQHLPAISEALRKPIARTLTVFGHIKLETQSVCFRSKQGLVMATDLEPIQASFFGSEQIKRGQKLTLSFPTPIQLTDARESVRQISPRHLINGLENRLRGLLLLADPTNQSTELKTWQKLKRQWLDCPWQRSSFIATKNKLKRSHGGRSSSLESIYGGTLTLDISANTHIALIAHLIYFFGVGRGTAYGDGTLTYKVD